MPDPHEQTLPVLQVIADWAGISLSDDELAAVAGAVENNRAQLAALRAALVDSEEPAGVFNTPAGAMDR
ncbi:MAG: hypothetical protein ACKVVP_23610 [Chloroflexota bacterium]